MSDVSPQQSAAPQARVTLPVADAADYTYWFAALRGERPQVVETQPQPGLYRERNTTVGVGLPSTYPFAIWREGDGMVGLYGFAGSITERRVTGFDLNAMWVRCAANPITQAFYDTGRAAGRFPDDLPPEAFAPPKAPGIGHNAPVEQAEELADQIDAAVNMAGSISISTDDEMAKAQAFRARLNELARDADKRREKEKAPHFEAGKVVDAKWFPLVKRAKAAAEKIADALSAYLTAKDREARRITAENEAARKRAEEEARTAAQAGIVIPAHIAPSAPSSQPAAVPTSIGGGYGRKAAVVDVRVAKVTDYDTFVTALLNAQDSNLLKWLDEYADRWAKGGTVYPGEVIPGVEITVEKKVR